MKVVAFLAGIAVLSLPAFADERVRGYKRKNGTIVAPHRRTASNKTVYDNYSFKGNSNPYTGKRGTKKASQ